MADDEYERGRRAEMLAFERGRAKAEVDSKFAEHERHLAAINGSIDKNTMALKELDDSLHSLELEVAKIKVRLGMYAAAGSLIGGALVSIVVFVVQKAAGG